MKKFIEKIFRFIYPKINHEIRWHRTVTVIGWVLSIISLYFIVIVFPLYFIIIQRFIYFIAYGKQKDKWLIRIEYKKNIKKDKQYEKDEKVKFFKWEIDRLNAFFYGIVTILSFATLTTPNAIFDKTLGVDPVLLFLSLIFVWKFNIKYKINKIIFFILFLMIPLNSSMDQLGLTEIEQTTATLFINGLILFVMYMFFLYILIKITIRFLKKNNKKHIKQIILPIIFFCILMIANFSIFVNYNNYTNNQNKLLQIEKIILESLTEVQNEISRGCEVLNWEDTLSEKILSDKKELKKRYQLLDICYQYQKEFVLGPDGREKIKNLLIQKIKDNKKLNTQERFYVISVIEKESKELMNASKNYQDLRQAYQKNKVEITKKYRDIIKLLSQKTVNKNKVKNFWEDMEKLIQKDEEFISELKSYLLRKYDSPEFIQKVLKNLGIE